MTIEALALISEKLQEFNYSFGEYNKEIIQYPYYTGEYIETAPLNEDGKQETTYIITAFTRNTWLELEEGKQQIKSIFNPVSGYTGIIDNVGIAIFYDNSFIIPQNEIDLKSIQINLRVKEWSVI